MLCPVAGMRSIRLTARAWALDPLPISFRRLNPPPFRATIIETAAFPGRGPERCRTATRLARRRSHERICRLPRPHLVRPRPRADFRLCLDHSDLRAPLSLFFLAGAAYEGPHLKKLLAQGLTAEATIDGVDVHSSRYGTTYKLNLSWTDATGATRHKAAELSEDFAPKIVSHGRATKSSLPIKYLADDPDADVLPVGDIDHARYANAHLLSAGITLFATCVALFVGLFAVRRYVRRNHPDVPAAYTTWFKLNASGTKRPRNTFMRVFLGHSYFTIPAMAALIYTLKWAGLFEPLEDLTGWTEYWIGLVVALLMVGTLSICGWCYDRHVEWRTMQRPEGQAPTPAA
jgi:hypothetical protein